MPNSITVIGSENLTLLQLPSVTIVLGVPCLQNYFYITYLLYLTQAVRWRRCSTIRNNINFRYHLGHLGRYLGITLSLVTINKILYVYVLNTCTLIVITTKFILKCWYTDLEAEEKKSNFLFIYILRNIKYIKIL